MILLAPKALLLKIFWELFHLTLFPFVFRVTPLGSYNYYLSSLYLLASSVIPLGS